MDQTNRYPGRPDASADGLSGQQVRRLASRCARRRRLVSGVRRFEAFSRFAWPGLAAVLALAILLKALNISQTALWIVAALWLAAGIGWMRRRHRHWEVPGWKLPAYLDRQSGARGRLLYALETGTSPDGIPQAALHLPFAPVIPRGLIAGWSLVLAALAGWYAMPVPDEPATAVATYTPLPVQRTQALLETLTHFEPEVDPFVESAKETLARLSRQSTGLAPSDFDSLQLVQEQAAKQLSRSVGRLHDVDRALRDFESVLEQMEAGGDGGQRLQGAARALGERLGDTPTGLGGEALSELLAQAQHMAGASRHANGGGEQRFTQADVQSLREQIRDQRRRLAGDVAKGARALQGAGRGGVEEGPGVAPLEYSHLTFQREAAFLDPQTFRSNPGDHTVLLATGLTKRADAEKLDEQGGSTRVFEAGTAARFWEKRTLPRHRRTLETYFTTVRDSGSEAESARPRAH